MNSNQFLIIFIIILFSLCGCSRKVNNLSENKDTTKNFADTSVTKKLPINKEIDSSGYYKSKLSFDEYIKQHPNLNKQIEFEDLIELLAVDRSSSKNNESEQRWTVLSDNLTSPFNWLKKSENNKKIGEIIITFDGKPAEIRDEKIIPIIWTLTLIGDTAGVKKVDIVCSILTHSIGEIDIQSLLKKKNIKFDILKSTGDPPKTGEHTTIDLVNGEKQLKLFVPNKEPIWMIYTWSCQTTGCTASFKIYYNETQYKLESINSKG